MTDDKPQAKFIKYLSSLRQNIDELFKKPTGGVGSSPGRFRSSPGSFKQHRRKELALSKKRKAKKGRK